MITAANAIGALTEIVINKPEYTEVIINALLKLAKAKYYINSEISPECCNVAIGYVLKSFKKMEKQFIIEKMCKHFWEGRLETPGLK